MAAIRLADSTPRRLYFDGSDWHLELESYTPVDRDVFTPTATIVQGVDAIHSTLADTSNSRDLVPRIKPLLQERPKSRVSFAILDGQLLTEPWPFHAPAASKARSDPALGSVPPTVQRSLVDLRNELDLLRTQVQELELLIAKFEPHSSHTSNENSLTHEEATFDAI